MVCSKCGQEIMDGVKFCTKCGTKCNTGLVDKKDYILPVISIALSVIGIVGFLIAAHKFYGSYTLKMPLSLKVINICRQTIFPLLIYIGLGMALIAQYKNNIKNVLALIASLIPCSFFILLCLIRLANLLKLLQPSSSLRFLLFFI